MTLSEFVERYKNGVDYDGMYGRQCVDYVNEYAKDVLGIKNAFYGQGIQYAYQVYADYNSLAYVKEHFERIANARSNYPVAGDVIVWAKERNGYAGHIAVVLDATEHTIKVAEQNYDGKGSVRVYTYQNYNHVLGWLRARSEKKNRPSVQEGQTLKSTKRAVLYHDYSAQSGAKRICDFSKFESEDIAVIKAGSRLQADKVVEKSNKNIWIYIEQYDGWVCIYDYENDEAKR